MRKLDDNELVKLAVAGNEAAFETLLERHYMTVYKIAYKSCGVREDAEDITQDVLVKLASAIKKFEFNSSFTTWLYRIVINASNDFLRQKSGKKEDNIDDKPELSSNYPNQEDEVSAKQLFKVISKLPEKFREAFLLVFAEGMSHAEAGQILGCEEKTVSWRVFQARKILRTYIEYRK